MTEFYYSIIFLFGTFVGSFINVVLYRVPRHESIVFPPSHCTRCGTILKPQDLVPVLSWLVYRGRCKYCGGKVSFVYPFIELLEGGIFLFSFHFFWGNWFLAIKGIVLLTFFLIITVLDVKYQIISDGINLTLFIMGLIFVLVEYFQHYSPGYELLFNKLCLDSFLALLVGAGSLWLIGIIGEAIFKMPAMGGGDVKMMAGLSLFIGYKYTVMALILAFFLGAILGVLLLLLSWGKKSTYIPFGPYLALATVIFYFRGEKKIIAVWEKLIGHLLY
jgi:leader peptidase (prepilin peptidase)/N-methyltransferase